jgi:hypothetical protein
MTIDEDERKRITEAGLSNGWNIPITGIEEQEPIGDYLCRIWVECREKAGMEVVFLNWCMQNHWHIVKEFVAFDAMMSGE